ncbi:TlpA disulfide reductase family protein [Emticicia sp. C21]|uniref:TlpA family protein disulfide reductase n=1 Tax=Emticicia sp. C21 TaxID=2302915 RepID=UPI000E344B1B|nr:TlpA disulfide reductase family protein [Emticicia sp. C21]RFS18204.1 TlpA family protein disulfide reductase [Emticicia sp. C21]
MKKLFNLLFLLCLLGTSLQATANTEQADSTIIIVQKTKGQSNVFLQYTSPFGEYKNYVLDKNKTDTVVFRENYPFRIISNDANKQYKNGRQLSFLLYPGEKLYLSKDSKGVTQIKSLTESIRTNELAFFDEFEKQCGEFEGFAVEGVPSTILGKERIQKLQAIHQKRVVFLDGYKNRKNISETYYEYLKALFLNNYLLELTWPYYSQYIEKRAPADKETAEIFAKDLKINDKFFHEFNYRGTILRYLIIQSGQPLDTPEINYLPVFEAAMNKLSGITLEVALLDIINNNKRNIDKSINLKVVEKLAEIARNSDIKAIANNMLPFYRATAHPVGDNMPVLNSNFETQEFNTVFTKSASEYKYFYVDFWASWCAPCRAQMPASKKLKEDYGKKGIGFIYVSTDEDANAWKKATKQLNLSLQYSYMLPSGNASAIAKRFTITSIPRYLIIDANGNVISDQAPIPSDSKIKQMFDKLLKN